MLKEVDFLVFKIVDAIIGVYLDPPLGGKSAGPQSGKLFAGFRRKNAGDLKKHPDPRL